MANAATFTILDRMVMAVINRRPPAPMLGCAKKPIRCASHVERGADYARLAISGDLWFVGEAGERMAAIDELENRVREISSEVEGEKAVTRQVYMQSIRNGDQIGALRCEVANARVDIQNLTSQTEHMVGEVVQSTALVRSHGLRLEALTRDIGLLRNDVTALRRGQEELHVRVDGLETRLDRLEELAVLKAELAELKAEVKGELAGMKGGLAEVNRKLDILVAAVAPRGPA
jgi:chromosome segregation ATPase